MRAQALFFVTSLALLLSGVTTSFQSAGDYPQWRGQHRDGAASGFVRPKAWPETLVRRWKVEVGEGYGTPLVVNDTIYTFTRRDGNEVMTALSAATGEPAWHTSYPAPYEHGQPAAAHGAGPKATPLFHEGKLFTVGISGIVTAFDATTGAVVWKTPAPAEPPFFGAASSAVGDEDVVIVHPGNYGPLTAFDTALRPRCGVRHGPVVGLAS